MSLAEVREFDQPTPRAGDRTPPQDVVAEQCVLGSMLLSKDAIADVVEAVRGADFYRPAHELVYNAILDLYGRGEPADAITVADELTKRGEITRVGGHPYLHDLLASVPMAANAGYYAEIVREKAILRRLVDASVKIAQLGYSAEGDVDEIVDAAQAEVYAVTERRASEDYKPLSELMEATLDEIEAIEGNGGKMAGVPTGFVELDELTNGLHGGQMIIVAARPAMGKALALDTRLPTPDGWTTMGEVAVGDRLLGADGRATTVVAATEVMVERPCYRLTFSDGTTVVADAEHQWRATSRASRRASSENAEAYHFPREAIDRVVDAAIAAAADDDQMVTLREVVNDLGTEFRHVVQSVAGEIGSAGRAVRRVAGEQRSYDWHAPVYSRQVLLGALAVRVAQRKASSQRNRHTETVTTEQMAAAVHLADGRSNWAVPVASAVEGSEATLPVPPYAFGVWLGDGHSAGGRFTSADPDVAALVVADGVEVTKQSGLNYGMVGVQPVLRDMGVLGNKHIPNSYLRASISQRSALLAGLLDTDGTVQNTGAVQFVVTNRALALGVRELIISLGYRCGLTTRQVAGHSEESSTAYVLNFTAHEDVFRLERKKATHRERRRPPSGTLGWRYVMSIEPIDSVPVRCVEVDNPDHMYLATDAMIPTHNSTIGLDFARSASIKNGLCSAIFSLEMSQTEITMRLLSAEAEIALNHIRKGQMTEDDWTRMSRKMGEVSEAPLFIDDSPNLTMMEIRAKARRLKQRHDLRLVIIDYMQLMSSGKKVESRQLEVSEFSRQIKLLAKELHVPVVAISQLNRGPEQRTDKKPMVADLRESGSLEQDADMIILLHREDYYDKESPRLGEADLIVAKHRNGPTRDIPVVFQGHYSRFKDMQH